ncbi:MAG: TIGR03960 family B12-binding radical SAM protein [Clostridiales bacterium]|nr:TIGR03960 family B12-binding radical SAM protein [Clostridiales bacterium]MDO4349901.1 TIGR03960 family B12-binding radical SAM protein [Eubacteriales bacterium]MDY4008373.1 TIGR03960 family B12-binding radical SAM protein [Candidatus Limiplasma sp.]
MKYDFDALLSRVEKPARYTGSEMNAEVKPLASVEISFAFCFPDTYEVAMSHLGMKILYGILNDLPYAVCERFCMPWVDMLSEMKRAGVPLLSLESHTPLCKFDIVGFTLQYEMSYTNILEMLHLGGVPVKADERGEDDPIVVAGGPCAFNPEPLCMFIDAFMIGDGEDVIIQLTDVINDCRKNHVPRKECLRRLAGLRGVYVPSLYHDEYNEDGTLKSLEPIDGCAPKSVLKCIVTDFENAYASTHPPVPYLQVVFDRIMLEIMRGCTRGCRFCQAGMLYRPVRERSVEKLVELAKESVENTGYEEISLSSLSSSDYSHISELAERLTEELKDKRVSLSLPSLRVDKFVQDTLTHTQKVKKSSLTFAPEAGTQRLRDVINKNVTEADLVNTLTNAFSNGWSAVKLYFMTGLPTETDEDLIGIAELAKTAAETYYRVPKQQRVKGLRITCSASVFVPKPFTPFQWCAQDEPDAVRRKQRLVKERFMTLKSAHFNYHDSAVSQMEACFAVGDRRLARVLYRAWELGCRLDGWTEQFRYDLWQQAFTDCGLDIAFYAHRKRGLDELLPWDHIDAGISKAFLRREYEKAMNAQTTRDCREGCNGCGLQKLKGVCRACE